MNTEHRLARLEHIDEERRTRVQHRALDQLTLDEYHLFAAFVQRTPVGTYGQPSWAEWDVLRRVDTLILADAESHVSDLITPPGDTYAND